MDGIYGWRLGGVKVMEDLFDISLFLFLMLTFSLDRHDWDNLLSLFMMMKERGRERKKTIRDQRPQTLHEYLNAYPFNAKTQNVTSCYARYDTFDYLPCCTLRRE